MSTFVPDYDGIFASILNASVSAAAREEASPLVDCWIAECAGVDAVDETVGVELPFYFTAAPNTFVVGTIDRIARDADGVFGCEWKSTAKRSAARGAFPGWNSDRWLDSIAESHQVPTYAAALAGGTFVSLPAESFAFAAPPVRVLVRAVSKSTPPEIWPSARGAFVSVSAERIESTLNAYRVVAEQIRAARRTQLAPWSLPGHQCIKFSKYKCAFYDDCRRFVVPPIAPGNQVRSFSPGSQKAVEAIFTSLRNDKNAIDDMSDLVILSASTLGQWMQCGEAWRRASGGGGHESSDAQETGTVVHAALAELYIQHQRRSK